MKTASTPSSTPRTDTSIDPAGDPNLYPILEAHIQELISRSSRIESFADQVRSQLTHEAIGRGLRAKQVARNLGIRITSYNVCYTKLLRPMS